MREYPISFAAEAASMEVGDMPAKRTNTREQRAVDIVVDADRPRNKFLDSLQDGLRKYGSLTENQINAVLNQKEAPVRKPGNFIGEVGDSVTTTVQVVFVGDKQSSPSKFGERDQTRVWVIGVDEDDNRVAFTAWNKAAHQVVAAGKGSFLDLTGEVQEQQVYNSQNQTVLRAVKVVEN